VDPVIDPDMGSDGISGMGYPEQRFLRLGLENRSGGFSCTFWLPSTSSAQFKATVIGTAKLSRAAR
jgi:hypothetical protein